MKNPLNLMLVSLMVIFFFGLASVITPSAAKASWPDERGNLPGIHEFPTELAIVAGVAIVGAITYLIIKKNKSEKRLSAENSTNETTEKKPGTATDSTQTSTTDPAPTSLILDTDSNQSGSKLGLYFDVDSPEHSSTLISSKPGFSDLTFKVGFSVGF